MISSRTIIAKRPGSPKSGVRLSISFFTCLVSSLCFLNHVTTFAECSSPPAHEGPISGSQPIRGPSSLSTTSRSEGPSPPTPLLSLLVSATSSSSASVPTSLAASSSTLGLLASSTDQELNNETGKTQELVTKTHPIVTVEAATRVQPKEEVFSVNLPKSGSGRITANKRGYNCGNSSKLCETLIGRPSNNGDPKLDKRDEATLKDLNENKSMTGGHREDKSTSGPSPSTNENFAFSALVQLTTDLTRNNSMDKNKPAPSSRITSKKAAVLPTAALPKTTTTEKTGTTLIATVPFLSPAPDRQDPLYDNQQDLSDYTEYSDARFAEERRQDANISSEFIRDHSREIADDLDLYDMERDINPTEGATLERTRPNRNSSIASGSLFAQGHGMQEANLTGESNQTKKQIFFAEHFPLRKLKHRTWFAQQHRLGRHELDPIDDGPFSSLIWKDKKYLISVLVPIGVGIAGAIVFVVAAYATRSCRGAPQTFIPTVGTDLFLQHVHSRNDDIFLLMETTDDEM